MSRVRLSAEDKIALMSNLTTMLGAGIPILEVVESLLQEAKGNQNKILKAIQQDITDGKHMSVSFAKFPYVFNSVTINLVKAAEEAGTLETTLNDLKITIEKEQEFSDKVKSAMMYPVFVMIVFFAVLIGMLVYVVPKISDVFLRLNVTLPTATKVMITASQFILGHPWQFVGGGTGLILLLYLFYYFKKELLLNLLFSLPVISRLMREIDLTRFSRSMHLLLSSGLPVTYALKLAEEVVLKKEVRDLIKTARENAVSGKQFSEGLRTKKNIIPSMMIKLMEVGEQTGKLDKSMQDISERMDYEVSKSLKKTTALLEPLMLVFIGVAVGGMMMAIIAPIYGLISSVGAL